MMFRDVCVTALLGLPVVIPLAVVAYGFLRILLKRFCRITQAGCMLVLTVLAAGMFYGFLRFNGILLFPDDNSWSVNWLGDSWRDDGFRYMYGCSTFAVAILAALRAEKRTL